MNDKKNELQSADSNSGETLSRAERIKAIKESIRKNTESPTFTGNDTETLVEQPAEKSPEAAPQTEDENSWEDELAERISRRIEKVKSGKANTYGSIVQDNTENSSEASVTGEEDSVLEDNQIAASAESCGENNISEETAEPEESIQDLPENGVKPVKKTGKKKKKKKTLKESLLGLIPQKNDSIGERLRKIVFLGSCVAIIVCGYIVADYYIDNALTQSHYDDLISIYNDTPTEPTAEVEDQEEEEYLTPLPNAQKLLDINSEIVGVINIPDTEVNYPVLQSDDLEKYLTHNVLGEEARAGALFLDYRNRFDYVVDGKLAEPNSDNLIIYGHNMGNGMMFGTLKNYRNDSNYYGEHPVIELNSNYACYKYKIFAFFIIDADDTTETAFDCWNHINFMNEDDFYDYVNEAKRRTIRLNDVDVKYGDKLLTLSTCNSIFGQDGGGRLIIMARLVRDGEDPLEGTQNSTANPNIKWPTLYYKYNKNEKYDPDAEFVPYNAEAKEETTNTEE